MGMGLILLCTVTINGVPQLKYGTAIDIAQYTCYNKVCFDAYKVRFYKEDKISVVKKDLCKYLKDEYND